MLTLGIDRRRPFELAKTVIHNHNHRCRELGWNHMHAYRYMVELYPACMWQK